MDLKDWIMIGAVIAGPILAVQAQKIIESFRDKRQRRQTIFKTLMSTRGERLSREHVKALNMIDIEFYGRKIFRTRYQTAREKAVTNAWKKYNTILGEHGRYQTQEVWLIKCDELFTKLLYEMSQALRYDYDEVQIQRDSYRPDIYGKIEMAQLGVLAGWEQILLGNKSLPMQVTSFPGMQAADKQLPNDQEQPRTDPQAKPKELVS